MNKFLDYLPRIVFVIALMYVGVKLFSPYKIESKANLNEFSKLPVSADGRTKPLDTVARNSLMSLSGRQSLTTVDGQEMTAIEWYIELLTKPDKAVTRRVFRIDHPEMVALIGFQGENRTRFTYSEIFGASEEIGRQAMLASQVKSKGQDPYQKAALTMYQRLSLFSNLSQLRTPYLVPPMTSGNDWRSLDMVLSENPNDPDALAFLGLLQSFAQDDHQGFNVGLASYAAMVEQHVGFDARKSGYEVVFNHVQPFKLASVLYVFAFLLGCFGVLSNQLTKPDWSKSLLGSMASLLVVALIVQTIGIATRVYLQGRPPVTNLYSSAVFIGWFGVIIGVYAERQMKLGLAGLMAAVIGFGTLVVAHNLGGSGDTMGMMQAVLDSNFWLTTHVVVIAIGYSATFFAGFMAIAYVLLGVFTRLLDHERGKSMAKMIYGVICFATVTSFIGTVLGGIWADQSWGRFWGWDAKENGAVLIVLINLIILHARWGGMIKDRGLIVLAIFGNIVTAWSWFGTNMLGVGLHSYGFMQSAVFWISMFVLSQLVLMSIGMVPLGLWRSKFERGMSSASDSS